MNDHHLLEKIERRIQSEQPVDDVVIDGLADSMPRARPGFQQNLEDQLLARYQPQGTAIMTPIASAPHKPRIALPLTLAAALLAAAFVASILTFAAHPDGNFSAQILQRPTATMTVEPTVMPVPIVDLRPVVIALENLPRGTRINEEVAAQLGVVYWPAAIAPDTAFADVADLNGLILYADVEQWQPILQDNVIADSDSLSLDNAAAITLPSDKVAVSIPVGQIESVPFGIQEGDRIDVMATMLFIDAGNEYQVLTTPDASAPPRLMTQQIAEDAMVVFIGRLASDSNATPLPTDIVTLAVSPEEAVVLTWAIEAMLPLTFVTGEADTTPSAADSYRQLGLTDYQQRNYEGAVENFTQCAKLGSDNIDCYYLRGLAHYYLGNCDDAWIMLQDSLVRVQILSPQEPILSTILEGLKRVQEACPAYADKIITDNPLVVVTPTLGN